MWQDDRGPAAQIPGKGERNTAIWAFGAISMTGLSKLFMVQPHFNSAGYYEAVQQAILPSSRPHNYVLYHDRYPAHTSKQTQTWMDNTTFKQWCCLQSHQI
jgi:hypothetical protein